MSRKVAEVRELPDEELLARLESGKEELFNLRFQLATGQLDNPMRIRQVRHEIARLLTILRQRHLESEVEAEVARSEAVALERSREAQARGELKGTKLADAITEVPSDAVGPEPEGDIPEGAPGVRTPSAGPITEKEARQRGLRRRFRRRRAESEETRDEAQGDTGEET